MNKDSETVLYRKYRPKVWKEVLGQDHVVKVLEGSIELRRLSHAYLFAGGRGTGKTTLARIFASEIGSEGDDIYEIDAASNRGIDDIRELREAVATLPFRSKYKVYIVDEVHMLTEPAFNALLKTLEEPPAHVIFMLATTEPEALPDTVLSRCQIFNLKKPARDMLSFLVEHIAKKEGFSIETGVSDLIAGLGDGSFRDTLGVFQKVLSFSKDKKISLREVETVTGAPKSEYVRDFVRVVITGNNDMSAGFEIIEKLESSGADFLIFSELVLDKFRNILTLMNAPRMEVKIKERVGEEDFVFIKEMAGRGLVKAKMLTDLLDTIEKIGRSAKPALALEVYLTLNRS